MTQWAGRRVFSAPRHGSWMCLVVLVLALVGALAGVALADEPEGPAFGPTLDWADDGARAYEQRLDVSPSVLDKPAVLPITSDERGFLDQFFAQATDVGSTPSVSLEPTVPLSELGDEDMLEVAEVLGDLTERYGTDATVALAPEMNSPDRAWGLRPVEYVRLARALAAAIEEAAPRVRVVWVPAEAARALPYEGAPAAPAVGGDDGAAVDTTGDGALDERDDPYGPYWPGDDAVDDVGLAVRYLGTSEPSPSALVDALGGTRPDGFVARFAGGSDRAFELRTAAALRPGAPGSERSVKAAWERQVLDPASLAGVTGQSRVVWLEVARPEPAASGAVVDWRATRTPALAADLREALRDGDAALAPSADASQPATRPGGGSVLSGTWAWSVVAAGWLVGLGLLWLGLSGRPRGWRYPDDEAHRRRDLRIDLLRGVAICFVVVNHLNFPSLYHLLSQEALGPISGAELFVTLSGLVLALVYRPRAERGVRTEATLPLWARAWKLYVTALVVVVLAYLSGAVPGVNARVLTTFTDQAAGGAAGATYDLYGGLGGSFPWPIPGYLVGDFLLLQLGPFQFNVIGLYIILLLLTPFFLAALDRGWGHWLLGGSLAVYASQQVYAVRLLPSQFEDAFPFLTWQVLFVLGLVAGWYRAELLAAAGTRSGRAALAVCVVLFLAALFFTWTNPYLANAYDVRLAIIPDSAFADLYQRFFQRTSMGVGRLLTVVVALVTLYAALTAFWRPVERALGPVLIPLGQATLYVFIMHVLFALVTANIPVLQQGKVLYGTIAHTLVLAALWLMVRWRVLFNLVPR